MPNQNNTHIATASKGMSMDTKYKYQPEGKASFILNGVLESTAGDYPTVTNELGTLLCTTMSAGFIIIGVQQLDGDEFAIFSVVDENGYSEIGIFNQATCEYKPLVTASCLNFNSSYRIKTLFRILGGCERVVYFTDGVNPYRSINIDKVSDYYDENQNFDCSRLELSRPFQIPGMELLRVDDGNGQIPLGTWRFRIRYLDQDLNPTNWMLLTAGIPIVDESLSGDFYQVDGGYNIASKADSEGGVPISSKSITLQISNLDLSFPYYQIVAIGRTTGIGFSTVAYILQPQTLSYESDEFTYTGPNPSSDITTDLASVTVDPGIIDIVEGHAQIDNRLFLANLSNPNYNYGAVQRAANDITIEWTMAKKPWEGTSISHGSGKSPYTYTEFRTFMADEVYALGIRGFHKKGWSTSVFHIPGRAEIKNTTLDNQQLINLGNSNPHYRNKVTIAPGTFGSWDKEPLTIIERSTSVNSVTQSNNNASQVDEWDARHLGAKGTTIPRWKMYNTAIQYSNKSVGLMAYYEVAQEYPNVEDCTGERVFPTGSIRHHKFPDRTLVGLYSKTEERTTNIYNTPFDGATLLDDREEDSSIVHILGIRPQLDSFFAALPQEIIDDFPVWEIVVGVRNDSDKTVIDKGYLNNGAKVYKFPLSTHYNEIENKPIAFAPWELQIIDLVEGVPDPVFGTIQMDYLNDKYAEFVSPKVMFNKQFLNGTYYKHELEIEHNLDLTLNYIPESSTYSYEQTFDIFGSATTRLEFVDLSGFNPIIPDFTLPKFKYQYKSRQILESMFLAGFTPVVEENQYSMHNTSRQVTKASFNNTEVRNPFYNNYKFISNVTDPLISNPHFVKSQSFDRFSDSLSADRVSNISFAALKRTGDVYSDLFGITYRTTNSYYSKYMTKFTSPFDPAGVIRPTFSGDCFIGKFGMVWKHAVTDDDDDKLKNNGTYVNAFYESEINVDLRHEGSTLSNKIFKRDLKQATVDNLYKYIKLIGEDNEPLLNNEFWGYNKDYSGVSDEVSSKSLPLNYDYCAKCDNKFPFRIRYSEKGFQDQVLDKYKVFLANNFTDLPGDTLAINNLFVDKNELYAHTPRALYFIPTRQQSLQTNENTIYIGTGEIFAVPPRRLSSLNYAYGGSVDPWATVPSEFGTLFIDSLSGKVFMLQEGLKEISTHGMRNFFENELGLTLNTQVKSIFGKEYPFKSPTTTTDLGIGYNATFDTRHRRFILHKRDYEMLAPTHKDWSLRDDGLYFKNKRIQSLTDNYGLFRNKSWTLTYSLAHESWASFHSYFPDFIWNSESDVFSTVKQLVDSNFIYKHNKGNYTTYYNKPKADFILELVSNPSPMTTKKFGPIRLIHDTQIYDSVTRQFKDVYDLTFERGIFYASDISTGELNIRQQSSFGSVTDPFPNRILFERKGREVHMNEILDVVSTDLPIFTSEWTVIQPNYFIDKMVNTNAVDFNKSLFTKSRMVDQYMVSRLFFNPNDNIKITFEGLISEFKPFIR